MSTDVIPSTGFVRVRTILHVVPISRSTWWAWVASGKAPAGIKLGPRITAWKAEDINAFLASFNQ